ncbi:hypothetical protein TNCV_3582151 [Trichonephila clavipes]|nr:hypothetical protein TNCV_3582151 [Trichonephila clavipes]
MRTVWSQSLSCWKLATGGRAMKTNTNGHRMTRRRWTSASRVKRDSLLNTIGCQFDDNRDDWLRHDSRRSHRYCVVEGRCLKGRCERNPVSAKHRDMVKSTTVCGGIVKKLQYFE